MKPPAQAGGWLANVSPPLQETVIQPIVTIAGSPQQPLSKDVNGLCGDCHCYQYRKYRR
jgi:hypothetical protein